MLRMAIMALAFAGGLVLAATVVQAQDVTADGSPRHRQGGLHLRLPDGGQLPHPARLLREPRNPEYKAPWNQLRNIPRVFTPEDKAVPDAQLGHALFHRSAWICAPNPSCSRCRRSKRIATSASSSSTSTRTTSTTSAAAPPATTAAASLIAGPGWKGETPQGHQASHPLRDRAGTSPYFARSFSTRTIWIT